MTERQVPPTQSRRFGPSALVMELNSITSKVTDGDSSSLAMLSEPMRNRFTLTEGQESELRVLEQDKAGVSRLQSLVEENARSANPGQFVVTLRPDRGGSYSHELRLERPSDEGTVESALASGDTPITSLRIAHCNADCGDWGWG